MARIDIAANMLAADNAALDDDQDLVPMVVPGVAGDDKGVAMTRREFTKRIRSMLLNRNGTRRTEHLNIALTSFTEILSITITPSKATAKILVSASVYFTTSQTTVSETTGVISLVLYRGDTIIVTEFSNRPGALQVSDPRTSEPIIAWTVDSPASIEEQTYTVRAQREGTSVVRAGIGSSILVEEL